jgi:hypothetical protein
MLAMLDSCDENPFHNTALNIPERSRSLLREWRIGAPNHDKIAARSRYTLDSRSVPMPTRFNVDRLIFGPLKIAQVKRLPQEAELSVLAERFGRMAKERVMRRRNSNWHRRWRATLDSTLPRSFVAAAARCYFCNGLRATRGL